jgi:hypothetical protein
LKLRVAAVGEKQPEGLEEPGDQKEEAPGRDHHGAFLKLEESEFFS